MDWIKSYLKTRQAQWALITGAGIGMLLIAYVTLTAKTAPTQPVTGSPEPILGSSFTNNPSSAQTDDTSTQTNPAAANSPATGDQVPTGVVVPASLLDLQRWKLTLPVGSPDEIMPSELATYSNKSYFFVDSTAGAVVFRTPAGGTTTQNSKYPRTELREMNDSGTRVARWSNTSGKHVMEIKQTVTRLTANKKEVVVGQIHDSDDDVIMIRLENKLLFVERGGKNVATLDSSYDLGKVFTVRIVAEDKHIQVFYEGAAKATIDVSGDDYYFKAGCYLQSTVANGNAPDDYAEVKIYQLSVVHS